VASRSKPCTALYRRNTAVVGSSKTRGMAEFQIYLCGAVLCKPTPCGWLIIRPRNITKCLKRRHSQRSGLIYNRPNTFKTVFTRSSPRNSFVIKSRLTTRHAGAKGERKYSSYSLLTSAVYGVCGQRHAPAFLYPRRKDRYSLDTRLGGPQSWFGHRLEQKSSAFARDRTPAVQSVAKHYRPTD
jgi:hypothetical protein